MPHLPPTGHRRGLYHFCVLIPCPPGIFRGLMTLTLESKVGLIPGVLDFLSSYHSAFACWLHDHRIQCILPILCLCRKCTASYSYCTCMLTITLTFDPHNTTRSNAPAAGALHRSSPYLIPYMCPVGGRWGMTLIGAL